MNQQHNQNPQTPLPLSQADEEQQAISQIKIIASEIFNLHTDDSFLEEIDRQALNLPISQHHKPKQHSLTQRNQKSNTFDRLQEDDWISAYQLKINQSEPNKTTTSEKKRTLPPQNEGYLKPVRNFKKKTLEYIEEKKKQKQQESMITKSNNGTLKELYAKKKPLYNKYIDTKMKKEAQVKVSRLIKETQQVQGLTLHPKINHNYQLPSFDERQKMAKANAVKNEAKILDDYMKPLTFQPRLNPNSQAQSVVKKHWEKKEKSTASSGVIELKGISESMIKTGSFFSDGNDMGKKNNSLDVHLQSVDELSYVFEIQDIIK